MFGRTKEIHCNSEEELTNLLFMHYKVIRQPGLHSSTQNHYKVTAKLARSPFTAYGVIYGWVVKMPLRDWQQLEARCQQADAEEQILTGDTYIHKAGRDELESATDS